MYTATPRVAVVMLVLSASPGVLSQSATGRILHVGGAGEYRSVQDAVADARDGDAIQVAQGVYSDNVRLTLSKSITIQGGWDADFTTRSNDRSLTVIDGGGRDSVFYISAGSGINISVILEGFTLRNGNADRGGGIRAEAVGSGAHLQLTLSQNSISDNASTSYGGGVQVYASSPQGTATAVLSANGNYIQDNTSTDTGGGLALWSLDDALLTATLTGNQVAANKASTFAAGIWINAGHQGSKTEVTMIRNVISGNAGPNLDGGGLAAYASGSGAYTVVSLSGNTIAANSSGYGGGGFFYAWGAGAVMNAVLTDNLIADNRGEMMFGGLALTATDAAAGTFQLTGNTFSGNWSGDGVSNGLSVLSGNNQLPPGTDASTVAVQSHNDILWGNIGTPDSLDLAIYADSASDPALVTASYSAFGTVNNHLGTFTADHCTIGSSSSTSSAGASMPPALASSRGHRGAP